MIQFARKRLDRVGGTTRQFPFLVQWVYKIFHSEIWTMCIIAGNVIVCLETCVHNTQSCSTYTHLCSSWLTSQDWIYHQLLTLSEPLHPTLPSLMQEFVNSILLSAITPGPRGTSGYGTNTASTKCHSPFTDEEVTITKMSLGYSIWLW